jgi:hypothetical protein
MAILGLDTLSGCSSIPSFLGGSADTPSNPTKTIFHNTNAPLNWVKETTSNNVSMRIIGGANGSSLTPGGSVPFTNIFTATSYSVSTAQVGSPTLDSSPTGIDVSPDISPFSSDAATLSEPQIPSHAHPYASPPTFAPSFTYTIGTLPQSGPGFNPAITGTNTSPGAHTHTMNGPHTHTISGSNHNHTLNTVGNHAHPFTFTQEFNVSYVDVIIATKS